MRLLTAVSLDFPDLLPACSDAIFRLIWLDEDARDESGAVQLTQGRLLGALTVSGVPEKEAQDLWRRASQPDVKEALKSATAEAVERGAGISPARPF